MPDLPQWGADNARSGHPPLSEEVRHLVSAAHARWEAVPRAVRGDYVMAFNRALAVMFALLTAYLMGDNLPFRDWAPRIALWGAGAGALLVQLRLWPQAAMVRRLLGIVLDVGGTTILLAQGGEATAFVYVVYLWVIIGYGFRFGGRYILAASLASIAGFAWVTRVNVFWGGHPALSSGLLLGLVVLPGYSFALIRQLAEARRQAERADHAKSVFLASVSHELRTPLNAIIGMGELLQGTGLDAEQTELVGTLNSAAASQLALVKDVLEYSRIEAGHGRVESRDFDVPALLREVRSLLAFDARRKDLLVNTFITARTPLRLHGDDRHLREILLNFCNNAVKFTSTGSVTIAADGIDAGPGLTRLRLEVMDTGIGIAPEAQTRIFGLFTQADATVGDRFGGTGLGLALCERQVRLMGGSIGVDSAPGAGSTFWISVVLPKRPETEKLPAARTLTVARVASQLRALEARLSGLRAGEAAQTDPSAPCIAFVQRDAEVLPHTADALVEVASGDSGGLPGRTERERFATRVAPDAGAELLARALRIAVAQVSVVLPAASHATPAQEGAPSRLAGLRVLVADDNAINRSVVSKMLDRAGLESVFATDGEQALAILTGGDVDAALMDVNMPVMDGITAARFYGAALLGTPRIPMIALTADASPETHGLCAQAGMDACLTKPVRTAELLAALDHVMPHWSKPSLPARKLPTQSDTPVLDLQTLADLKGLGGAEFVEQLVAEFKQDAALVLVQMDLACRVLDTHAFRTEAHSLCSIAANMGAWRMRELCAPWKSVSETELAHNGVDMLARLQRQWAATCTNLDQHVAAL